MKRIFFIIAALASAALHAATLEEQIANRAAIERVYHSHRTGSLETFEQALPVADLRRLVERDVARENFLRSHYGVEISATQIAAEISRITTTTRAPETLAEIKAALGGDTARFADAFVKPILVDRELRARFANDDALHASLRRVGETARTKLLQARAAGATAAELVGQLTRGHTNSVTLTTWRLKDTATNVAKAFADLPPQLHEVLAAQLRSPGDVSALIETPENFLLFVVQKKTEAALTAACLVLPKPNYDDWLLIHGASVAAQD